MALFITFEGGEGAGKSTQVRLLARRLEEAGHKVLALREPGGTPLGDYLRDWLKASDRPLTPEAELLLFAAARAELVRTVIEPALKDGILVVLDRYADSTTAYQGFGRGLDAQAVATANRLATGGLEPDLTILLDVPPQVGLARAAGRADEDGQRRFEDAEMAFHERVRQGFLELARQSPKRWLVLDGTLPPEQVAARVWERVARCLDRGEGDSL